MDGLERTCAFDIATTNLVLNVTLTRVPSVAAIPSVNARAKIISKGLLVYLNICTFYINV